MSAPAALLLGVGLYVVFRVALALAAKGLRALLPEAVARAFVTPLGLSLLALATLAWLRLTGAATRAAQTVDGVARDALVAGLVWLGVQAVTQLATRWYFERVRGVALPNVVRRVVAATL